VLLQDLLSQVSNELELVDVFGKPKTNSALTFFTGANFLAYASDLRVSRSANTGSNNAVANLKSVTATEQVGHVIQIKNEDSYVAGVVTAAVKANTFAAARYPGELGNSLKIGIWANGNVAMSTWEYGSYFDRKPGTSYFVAQNIRATANDEFHMVVVDEDGAFTGTAGTILEKFAGLSKATNAKDESGQSIYWQDVLFRRSKFLYGTGQPQDVASNQTWGVPANSAYDFADMLATQNSFSLVLGSDQTLTDGDNIRAYDLLKNAEAVDIQLAMTAGHNQTVTLDVVNNLATARKDCVAFVSPALANVQSADVTTAVINYRNNALSNVSTSYAVMDSGWKYQYDKYNDTYRWIPLNGDIAGLCARTDTDRDPWFSPAGLVRGQVKNVIKLAYAPTKANRDELYKNGINPVVSFPGEGTMLFGDKTLLGRPSAFDRINVRRLFIVLEKSIAQASRSSLFEFNDEFTRAQFVNLVEPFLRTVQGRRGIYDYRVVCDETNNTPEVIDRNEFVGDIYVKPARSINFIQLNFIAVRTGVNFEEIVGKF
jgi:Phage tail sheath protein subtilisin-like domain/Phage tail sheath C-terminal domain